MMLRFYRMISPCIHTRSFLSKDVLDIAWYCLAGFDSPSFRSIGSALQYRSRNNQANKVSGEWCQYKWVRRLIDMVVEGDKRVKVFPFGSCEYQVGVQYLMCDNIIQAPDNTPINTWYSKDTVMISLFWEGTRYPFRFVADWDCMKSRIIILLISQTSAITLAW